MSEGDCILAAMARRGGGVTRYTRRDGTVAWRARVHHEGRSISLGLYDSEADARAAVESACAQLSVDLALPGHVRLVDWGQLWLDARERSGRVRGIRQERSAWRTHVAGAPFADLPMRSITRPMIARWLTSLLDAGVHRQTVQHALRLVRSCLAAATDEGRIDANVAVGVTVPRGLRVDEDASPSWAWLTVEEIARLEGAEEVPQWARDVWTVAIYTGLRKGELAGLRWRDVVLDDDRPHLHVVRSYGGPTKSGKGREVPLLPPALEALRRVRRRTPGVGDALVWPSPSGGVWGGNSWDPGGWRRYALGATRPDSGGVLERHVRFHDLRHTCASHLVQGTWLAAPMGLYRVRQWLGHSSMSVTQRYAHLAPGGLHDLAASWQQTGNLAADDEP